jgi:hypothetical protein
VKGNNIVRYGDDRSRAYQTVGTLVRRQPNAGIQKDFKFFITRQQKVRKDTVATPVR